MPKGKRGKKKEKEKSCTEPNITVVLKKKKKKKGKKKEKKGWGVKKDKEKKPSISNTPENPFRKKPPRIRHNIAIIIPQNTPAYATLKIPTMYQPLRGCCKGEILMDLF